jgi:hypothetical protein
MARLVLVASVQRLAAVSVDDDRREIPARRRGASLTIAIPMCRMSRMREMSRKTPRDVVVRVPPIMRFRWRCEEAGEKKNGREKSRRSSKQEKTKCGGAVHHAAIRRALRQHSGDPEILRNKQLERR